MPAKNSGADREKRIFPLCDGIRTSKEIAEILDENAKYIQRVMKKYDLPRLPQAPRPGKNNPSYKTGRVIDRDGYVLVSAPLNHPHARKRKGRSYGKIYEHRLVMENMIGRYLDPLETVDHIDGIRLHNDPNNLRLFASNSEHLRSTISGQIPKWSKAGKAKSHLSNTLKKESERIHSYDLMKKRGDARLRQILLAWLSLDKDSPYLLGTIRHMEKAGIYDLSHTSLKHALDDLYRRYA